MTDEIRNRIRNLDPMHPGVPTEPMTTPSSRELLESIMSTPTIERPQLAARPRRVWYATAAAALVGAIAVGVILNTNDPAPSAAAPLELGLGEGGAMQSCMAVTADILRDMSPALLGTATAVEGEKVTLSIDRWYAGETDATEVVLHAPAGLQALIGGIDFQVGQQYFVTATDGVVNYCGYTDAYSPTLEAIFEEAFGA
ncbi:MAG: hypothetical protein WEA29_04105 [Acidimicrobiia bacterium]